MRRRARQMMQIALDGLRSRNRQAHGGAKCSIAGAQITQFSYADAVQITAGPRRHIGGSRIRQNAVPASVNRNARRNGASPTLAVAVTIFRRRMPHHDRAAVSGSPVPPYAVVSSPACALIS
jgi:hypothetical protein